MWTTRLETAVARIATLAALLGAGCGDATTPTPPAAGTDGPGGGAEGDGGNPPLTGTPDGGPIVPTPVVASVEVTLAAEAGVSGTQRVNFAVPLAPGALRDARLVTVSRGGAEIAASVRSLATHPDGSVRSVQVQIDADASASAMAAVVVTMGAAPTTTPLTARAVAETLVAPDGTSGPRVWARLPAAWVAGSGVVGPIAPEADVAATPLARWATVCNYADPRFGTDAFLAQRASRAVWLYDRPTTFYRGYARRGDLVTLRAAYREASIYRSGITGSGAATAVPVPEAGANDVKYNYSQALALHYLLTGDERFREAAEDVAEHVASLWPNPTYDGGARFWSERHAGFALLAYTWAAIVSDDRAARFQTLAEAVATAALAVQDSYPVGYADAEARCFAHHGDAHDPDEGNPYFGCSPWMSAILADGLDAYARQKGGAEGARVVAGLVKLGRILARQGRDSTNRPYYWMGVGTAQSAADAYDEHIGESAYVVAMAWHLGGRKEAALKQAADALVARFVANGEAGQFRSFNWQCRSAAATPFYLK